MTQRNIFDIWIMGETKALLSGLVECKEYIYMVLDD